MRNKKVSEKVVFCQHI